MRRKFLLFAAILFLGFCGTNRAQNQLLNFQALLNDNNGTPVPTGQYTVTFTFYDAATAGSALWSETQSVSVQDGLFSILLGGSNALDVIFDRPVWLGIKIGEDPELTPRTPITAVPSAINSLQAEDVKDRNIRPKSVTINGLTVIDSLGKWRGDTAGLAGPQGPQGPEGPQGPQGPQGQQGGSLYTWIKYADDSLGTNMSDQPRGKAYMGVAYNKPVPEESTNPLDYEWISVRSNPGGGNMPVGTVILFTGKDIPAGWQEVDVRDAAGQKMFLNGQPLVYIMKVSQ